MTFNELDSVPTFQRNISIQSVIDYIYAGSDIQHMIIDSAIEHIKPQWSDHALLSVKFSLGDYQVGPGLWRGSLTTDMSPDLSPQLKREAVKTSKKQVIKSFGIKYVSWRTLTLRQLDPNAENICTSDPDLMNSFAQQYYQMLYSIDTVEPTEIINYLDDINFDRVLPAHEAESLEAENFPNELMAQTNRVKKSSSPGVDGLGYPFLALLFRMPCLKQIVLDVYNDALKGIIPSSWQDIRVHSLLNA
ncbi:hypothetical protein HPULCUR_007943 [Helicostylum pulchrum]|uniref:Uncharacterized protein n=1 Tax=Helicostylum pulchrum TaxID=562976 RepID=A0ABP9Y7B4_9FUNG